MCSITLGKINKLRGIKCWSWSSCDPHAPHESDILTGLSSTTLADTCLYSLYQHGRRRFLLLLFHTGCLVETPVSCIHSQKWSPVTSRGGPGPTLDVLPKRSRSSHVLWELMQCLIQYVPQTMSLHSKNGSRLRLPSVWSPSPWASATFQRKRLEWSGWRAAIMGSVGNEPIRSHLILMQNSNVSGLLGLGKAFCSLSDFGWMFWLRSDAFPDAQRWSIGISAARLASPASFRRRRTLVYWRDA